MRASRRARPTVLSERRPGIVTVNPVGGARAVDHRDFSVGLHAQVRAVRDLAVAKRGHLGVLCRFRPRRSSPFDRRPPPSAGRRHCWLPHAPHRGSGKSSGTRAPPRPVRSSRASWRRRGARSPERLPCRRRDSATGSVAFDADRRFGRRGTGRRARRLVQGHRRDDGQETRRSRRARPFLSCRSCVSAPRAALRRRRRRARHACRSREGRRWAEATSFGEEPPARVPWSSPSPSREGAPSSFLRGLRIRRPSA